MAVWYASGMCGRFTLTCEDRGGLAAALGVSAEQLSEAEHRARYNIAPTDSHWVLHMKLEDRELLPAKWGLVNRWAKDATRAVRQINGRAEGLAKVSSSGLPDWKSEDYEGLSVCSD